MESESKAGPQDPVVLVTGSSQGIGAEVAARLKAAGGRVHVVSRDPTRTRRLEAAYPGRAHQVDLGSIPETEQLVEAILARDGRLDALVHAVGDFARSRLEEAGPGQLAALWASNVETSWNVFAAARPHLRATAGRAVFFGVVGLGGHRARTQTAAYAATKSSLLVLVRSWAQEEAGHGVRVNMVSPGLVPHADAEEQTIASASQQTPSCSASDVSDSVQWLLGEGAERVTGQNIEVSAGWML